MLFYISNMQYTSQIFCLNIFGNILPGHEYYLERDIKSRNERWQFPDYFYQSQ